MVLDKIRIALPRGEWSEPTQEYLGSMGLDVRIKDGPMTRDYGDVQLRMVRAGDVPRLVESGYLFGVTGSDLLAEAGFAGMCPNLLDIFDGKDRAGRLVLYAKMTRIPKNPVVVTRKDYSNLARSLLSGYLDGGRLEIVDGSDEGYVSSGESDAGFGLLVSGRTLEKERLYVVEDFGKVSPVLVGTGTYEEFRSLIKSLSGLDFKLTGDN